MQFLGSKVMTVDFLQGAQRSGTSVEDAALNQFFDRVAMRVLRYRHCEVETQDPFENGVASFRLHNGLEIPTFYTVELISNTPDQKYLEVAVRAKGERLNLIFENAQDAFTRPDPESTNRVSTQKMMSFLLT